MNQRTWLVSGLLAAGLSALFSAAGGCGTTIVANLTKERAGEITIVFQNTTPYLASFTYGTYDAWDRSPGAVDYGQLTVAANSTSEQLSLLCARNFAVGTAGLVDRMTVTNAIDNNDFDPDLFGEEVRFSSAPAGSDPATLPTAGTARGLELLLGVHYSCADVVFVSFIEDPDAPGGFRMDALVLLDEEQL